MDISGIKFKDFDGNLSTTEFAVDANNITDIDQWIETTVMDSLHPVGSIYYSLNSTNPSTLFGGTWERFAKGKFIVGVDSNDADFNAPEKTGGSATVTLNASQLPSHTHTFSAINSSILSNCSKNTHNHTVNSGGAHSHSIISKYYSKQLAAGTSYAAYGNGGTSSTNWCKYISSPLPLTGHSHGIVSNGNHTHTISLPQTTTTATGSSGSHNNLPPYLTTYIWKRIG